MRFALWRAGKDKTPVSNTVSAPMPAAPSVSPPGDLDLRVIWQALLRRKRAIIIPTLLAFALSLLVVNLITPRYKSEARILIDGRENVFLRPNGERNDERNALDPEAVASQVQLVLSRDLAREVIKKNQLAKNPEFDPVLRGVSPIKSLLALFGIGRDPLRMTPEERVLDAYYSRLTAYAVDKSRVIVIEFQSRDPELAARIANSVADGYLVLQLSARQEQAKAAGQWLSGEIDSLRKKVTDAESRVADFRSKSSLFIGTNNTSLSNQQLGEINTQLNNARALKSDAESKARLIRGMLQSGKPIEASEVLNSELIRRLSEQRVTLRAQLAEQSSTLLGQHPRIKELKAQLADLDRQLREEAGKISRSLENDARIASGRVEGLSNSLEQLKKQATSSNGDDVKLRALEREARAQRDLLESYLAKYREATTRETIDAAPSDGRIISRAFVSNTPAYPKKLPIVLIATLATLMLAAGTVATGELLRITAPRAPAGFGPVSPQAAAAPEPREPRPDPAANLTGIDRLADDLRTAGEAARKITIMGTGQNESIMLSALALARLLAHGAKVVLVDLSPSSPVLTAASVDPAAPGLADLMLGETSFGQVITRDRLSAVHLVAAGRSDADRALLQSPRLTIALDALLRVYDHVLLVVGTATDLPARLLTDQARAIVVPDPSMSVDARARLSGQLTAIGFASVTMLDPTPQPADTQTGPREAA
ncbi:lipopolysaccharide biosynthesis [Nitrobacter hamburgensis X14]|uniref:Lipopolysaccharide biosynthesis n=1 Tax=Nitrobacter hamburgensis (strain DSM 10229 / NCIMB 13809 / X14) TaxID=323097 RepID=Q1QKJ4_NITHX|nr:exopolysaccharide transport family protein [Nitrobacter hamburgensis]ABE63253.1 lipopolysaccharide biosynthesis [Nitrobacter hamburgensis X14]